MILVAEYLLSLWSASAEQYYAGIRGMIRFVFRWEMIFESVAVFHAVLMASGGLEDVYNPLNLLFFANFVQISRYIRTLHYGFEAILKALRVMTPLMVILIPLLFFNAYLLYICEHAAQPEKFKDMWSALWFAMVTATTVGYGDMSPVTPAGQVFTIIHMIGSIGLVGAVGAQIAIQVDKRIRQGESPQEITGL